MAKAFIVFPWMINWPNFVLDELSETGVVRLVPGEGALWGTWNEGEWAN
jgi:hypothetical protein